MVRLTTQSNHDRPKRYRLVEVFVEAVKLTADNVAVVAGWCGGRQVSEIDMFDKNTVFVAINIPTLNGVERASEGQYVLKDSDGVVSVMCSEEFEHKYALI